MKKKKIIFIAEDMNRFSIRNSSCAKCLEFIVYCERKLTLRHSSAGEW